MKDLHKAILRKEESFTFTDEALEKKDRLGLTPLKLAEHLYHKPFLHYFPKKAPVIPVFKEGICLASTADEYKQVLGVNYVPKLVFSSFPILRWTIKACKGAERRGWITTEQKWLGAYFDKEIENQIFPKVSVHWIHPEVGYGVFTEVDLPAKTFIGEYTGLLRKRKRRADQKNSYTFEYLIGESVDTPYTIDAKDFGSHVRFINHDEKGNCDPMLIFHDEIMRVIIYTNRKIEKGEQLTYDYGPDYWEKRESPKSLT